MELLILHLHIQAISFLELVLRLNFSGIIIEAWKFLTLILGPKFLLMLGIA